MTSNPLKTIPYHVPEALLRILQEQAREENLSTSAYITRVLCFHHFGHKNDFVEEGKIIKSTKIHLSEGILNALQEAADAEGHKFSAFVRHIALLYLRGTLGRQRPEVYEAMWDGEV